ncbi:MAG: flap endonuclease, partial [Actinomycetota bacterium]|nr:flap endonuclease [Actinomycetota bacterium]
ELFRAHFSKRPARSDPGGQDVKATVGLVESLLALLRDEDEDVTHVAVAFDNPIRSFRNDLFAHYKDDGGVPEALLGQFDLAEEATRALGLTVWSMADQEADDALATAAARWEHDVEQVRILSPDKDLGQCVRDSRIVLVDRRRGQVIDQAALRERRGIAPRSVPDWLALVGDRADGLPGIPGFGESTAAAVLARYERLENIPERGRDWEVVAVRGRERLASTLVERRDDALLYRRLATLLVDLPLSEDLDALRWYGVPGDSFLAFCDALGVEGLRQRPTRWA